MRSFHLFQGYSRGSTGKVARTPRPFECHIKLQTKRGIWNLENLVFTQLVADRAYEFLFVWSPLKMKGATGSPGNPIALYQSLWSGSTRRAQGSRQSFSARGLPEAAKSASDGFASLNREFLISIPGCTEQSFPPWPALISGRGMGGVCAGGGMLRKP